MVDENTDHWIERQTPSHSRARLLGKDGLQSEPICLGPNKLCAKE